MNFVKKKRREEKTEKVKCGLNPAGFTDMTLPLQLLGVVVRVGQQGSHVEHDLAIAKRLVQRLLARLTKLSVQTTSVPVASRNVCKLADVRFNFI